MLLSWTWPRDSQRCSGESPSRIGGLCWIHAYWFSATYRLPQQAFSFSELCLWHGMYQFYFSVLLCGIQCLKVWGVGPFFHPVRGPFILLAPWREGYGGCRSQGCHGYPSCSAMSDSWPHLPYFRHHSPSLSIVMSLNVAKCNLSYVKQCWPAAAPRSLVQGGWGFYTGV